MLKEYRKTGKNTRFFPHGIWKRGYPKTTGFE
jgi:hypothetical protein